MKNTVLVGLPNEGDIEILIEQVNKWKPTEVDYIGETVFFKHDNSLVSMKSEDFLKIFKK